MDEVFCIACKSCANPLGAVVDIATPCLQTLSAYLLHNGQCRLQGSYKAHTRMIQGSYKDDTRGAQRA